MTILEQACDPGDEMQLFCQDVFNSFARSDQRRWAEVYLRGLLTLDGRKSVRRIGEQVLGWRADQCLQQFVNQSPWDWAPVRRRIAERVAAALRPEAWVVEEVVLPKNGARSVGVARQFSASAGRLLNCQLGLSLSLASEAGSCPVNWSLMLPLSWDEDKDRRARAHVPAEERSRPRWKQLLELIDEAASDWDLLPNAVVVDTRRQSGVEALLAGLESRGLGYLVQVSPNTPAMVLPSSARTITAGEVVAGSPVRDRTVVNWRSGTGGTAARSQFFVVPLPGAASARSGPGTHMLRGRRHVLAEWPLGRRAPAMVWLTNLGSARLPELIDLTRRLRETREELSWMYDGSGLRHFEGRSFRGWHHHTTLVSAAMAQRLLSRLDERYADDLLLRSPG